MEGVDPDPHEPSLRGGRGLPRARWLVFFFIAALAATYFVTRLDATLYADMVWCVNGGRLDGGEGFGVSLYPLPPLTENFAIAFGVVTIAVATWSLTRARAWLVVICACAVAAAALGGTVTHHLAANIAQLDPGARCAPSWPTWLPK